MHPLQSFWARADFGLRDGLELLLGGRLFCGLLGLLRVDGLLRIGGLFRRICRLFRRIDGLRWGRRGLRWGRRGNGRRTRLLLGLGLRERLLDVLRRPLAIERHRRVLGEGLFELGLGLVEVLAARAPEDAHGHVDLRAYAGIAGLSLALLEGVVEAPEAFVEAALHELVHRFGDGDQRVRVLVARVGGRRRSSEHRGEREREEHRLPEAPTTGGAQLFGAPHSIHWATLSSCSVV
jgi:hypothetical protein